MLNKIFKKIDETMCQPLVDDGSAYAAKVMREQEIVENSRETSDDFLLSPISKTHVDAANKILPVVFCIVVLFLIVI